MKIDKTEDIETLQSFVGKKCMYVRGIVKYGIIDEITITKDDITFTVLDNKHSKLKHYVKEAKIKIVDDKPEANKLKIKDDIELDVVTPQNKPKNQVNNVLPIQPIQDQE